MAAPKYITITAEEANSKLLSVLQNRLAEEVPRSALMKWIRTGQIRLESKRTKPFRRVEYGQILRLPPQAKLKPTSSAPSPQSDLLHRVAETPDLLVVGKPAGLPMHPGSKHRISLTQYIA
ncbi:MAG: RluA family pseudouridine synthase, partial [Desulfohalobium sp.]